MRERKKIKQTVKVELEEKNTSTKKNAKIVNQFRTGPYFMIHPTRMWLTLANK